MGYVRRCGQARERGPFPAETGRPAWAGSSRTIGAAYKGGTPFRQCGAAAEKGFFGTADLTRIFQWLRCITSEEAPVPGLSLSRTAGAAGADGFKAVEAVRARYDPLRGCSCERTVIKR